MVGTQQKQEQLHLSSGSQTSPITTSGCMEPHSSGTHLPRREAPPAWKVRTGLGSPEAQEKVLGPSSLYTESRR